MPGVPKPGDGRPIHSSARRCPSHGLVAALADPLGAAAGSLGRGVTPGVRGRRRCRLLLPPPPLQPPTLLLPMVRMLPVLPKPLVPASDGVNCQCCCCRAAAGLGPPGLGGGVNRRSCACRSSPMCARSWPAHSTAAALAITGRRRLRRLHQRPPHLLWAAAAGNAKRSARAQQAGGGLAQRQCMRSAITGIHWHQQYLALGT